MYDEMKKFYKKSSVLFLLILALFLSVAMPVFFTYDYASYDYSSGKEVEIRGIEGVKARKAQLEKTEGALSTDKINHALMYYKSLPIGDEAYYKMEDKYPGIFKLLTKAYSPYGGENSFVLRDIPDAEDFYSKNADKIKGQISQQNMTHLSELEKREVFARAAAIEKPFDYQFIDQWAILIKSLIFVYVILGFTAIVIASQLFSFDKENNMDMILSAIEKKKLIRIGYKKVLAMLVYLTVAFFVCSLIMSLIIFCTLGVSGWNSQIQIMSEFFMSIYGWTFGQTYLWTLALSLISIMSIGLIGAAINAAFQRTYLSLMITALITVPPMFLRVSRYLPANVKEFLGIQPINGINLFSYIDSFSNYGVGSFRVLTSTMIGIVAVGCLVVCLVLSPVLFSRRING